MTVGGRSAMSPHSTPGKIAWAPNPAAIMPAPQRSCPMIVVVGGSMKLPHVWSPCS